MCLCGDDAEGVVYFGDPNLRMYVPGTDFSSQNSWDKPLSLSYDKELKLEGHTPFGSTDHPNEISPKTLFEKYLFIIVIVVIILLLIVIIAVMGRKK